MLVILLLSAGCQTNDRDGDSGAFRSPAAGQQTATAGSPPIRARHKVEELPFDLVVFDTVFWEPRDTDSLRKLIRDTPLVHDRDILEIGTGSGLVALCTLHAGAKRAVATDVNEQALANAQYNAEMLQLEDRLETRLVPLDNTDAFAVLGPDEKFDLIISNPPWEDDEPDSIDEYALYDPEFRLLDSLLRDLPRRLKPGGKALLAYGHRPAVEAVLRLSAEYGYGVKILDERAVAELPRDFLPGMLLEVIPPAPTASRDGHTSLWNGFSDTR